jgi:hypothetical protein
MTDGSSDSIRKTLALLPIHQVMQDVRGAVGMRGVTTLGHRLRWEAVLASAAKPVGIPVGGELTLTAAPGADQHDHGTYC